jgi:dipeptidase E
MDGETDGQADGGGLSRRGLLGAGLVLGAAALGGAALGAEATRAPQIFAVGGGFLVQPWETPLLQRHLLSLSPAKSPKICFLGAATGENPSAQEAFDRQMEQHDCRLYHFNIFAPTTLDFADYLLGMDIVYVNGGATRNLIALWREWDFDKALRKAWQGGVLMSGESAGMICWFQSGLTDSYPPELSPVRATGFLKGSACPHYDTRADRPTRFRQFIADGSLDSPGLALDQQRAVHYVGDQMREIVSAKKGAGGHRLVRTPTGYDEQPLPARYLGV